MDVARFVERFRESQAYVAWSPDDATAAAPLADALGPGLTQVADDFYRAIERMPGAARVIRGGPEQVARLRATLVDWLRDLMVGPYDDAFVARRWSVGRRHAEIGLEPHYVSAALSVLRTSLVRELRARWRSAPASLAGAEVALHKLLDLDHLLVTDAYLFAHEDARLRAESEEAALRQERLALAQARAEANLAVLLEASPLLVWIVRPDGSIAYVSRHAAAALGSDPDALAGRPFASLVGAEAARAIVDGMARDAETPLGVGRVVLWNAQRLDDFRGGPAILALGQDVTSLKAAQERAVQSARLAAIGEMMTGLAHESRNALARAQACLEMLALEVEDRPSAKTFLERIQKANDHLQRTFEEVRGYAAPICLEREAWSLRSLWRQAWQNLAVQRLGREVELVETPSDIAPTCVVDAFRIEQTFRNLFENALAACRDPVRLDVGLADATLEGRPAVAVTVRDNGPGLPAGSEERVFEPFFTTKAKGTGLGMAICRRAVEAHGGRIRARSALEGGAEITVLLPRE